MADARPLTETPDNRNHDKVCLNDVKLPPNGYQCPFYTTELKLYQQTGDRSKEKAAGWATTAPVLIAVLQLLNLEVLEVRLSVTD